MADVDGDLELEFNKIAEKIKAFRKSMNMSQQDFGKQAGLKAQRIGTIESNRIKATLGDLIRLSRTYQMSIDELVFDRPMSSKASPAAATAAPVAAVESSYASEEVIDRVVQAVDGLLDRYQEEFANYQDIEAKFDLPPHFLNDLKKGNEVPDPQLIKGLYRHQISALWLEFGEGRMFESQPAPKPPRERPAAPAAAPASGTMLERKVEAIYSLQKLMDSKLDDLMDR